MFLIYRKILHKFEVLNQNNALFDDICPLTENCRMSSKKHSFLKNVCLGGL